MIAVSNTPPSTETDYKRSVSQSKYFNRKTSSGLEPAHRFVERPDPFVDSLDRLLRLPRGR